MSEYGKNIQLLRQQRNWTRKELAEMIGKSEQQIYNWESGARNPSHPNLQAIIEAFGVTDFEFFTASNPELYETVERFKRLPKSSQYKIMSVIAEEWEKYGKE